MKSRTFREISAIISKILQNKIKLMKLYITILLFTSSLYANLEVSATPSEIFKSCAKCHGKDGKNSAFGKAKPLTGQSAENLIKSINFFKDGEFGKRGVTAVMAKQVQHLSKKQIEELATFISNLPK